MSRRPPARGRLRRAIAAGLVAGSCSTLAELPVTEECNSDADCPENSLCAIDQGRCLAGNEAAPRAHLGFDIRERAGGEIRYRVEVDGCDCLIQEAESIRELTLRRPRVSQMLHLGVATTDDPGTPLPSRFDLTQPSRFGQLPSPHRAIINDYPTIDDDTMTVVETVLPWPRYHPLDIAPPREMILWEIEPEGDLAPRYLGLVPPRTDTDTSCERDADCCEPQGECDPWPNYCDLQVQQCTAIGAPEWTFTYAYEPACSRAFEGEVKLFDPTEAIGSQLTPLAGASVQLRYADNTTEKLGTPVFREIPLDLRPPECQDDSQCDTPDEYCDVPSRQCFVALAGLPADRGSTTEGDAGIYRTKVYSYCDGETNSSIERRFEVTVTPPGALPSVDYIVDATFIPGPVGSVFRVGDTFCVPDWGASTSMDLVLTGEPRTVLVGDDVEYTCCGVDCLPASADDAELGVPTVPTSCDGRASTGGTTVEVRSDFVLDGADITNWKAAECVNPNPDGLGRTGTLRRLADCTVADAPCHVEDMALGSAEAPRSYRVRVESPVGSVLASGDFTVEVGAEAPPLQTITLGPRVLVTGVVDVDATVCGRRDAGADCAAREAIVLAERLVMPDEPNVPAGVPGPYFHSVPTFYDPVAQRDGAFVLPLDPGGVYVITALPATGAEGGPGSFAVVNLRADAPDVLAPLRLVLEDGVVVTLLLDQFDQRTSVVPVDRGSYLVEGSRLAHPGVDTTGEPYIDLNRIGECWTNPADGARQACRIRRLIPPGSDLARSQAGQVRFTARRSGQAECPQRCPLPATEP